MVWGPENFQKTGAAPFKFGSKRIGPQEFWEKIRGTPSIFNLCASRYDNKKSLERIRITFSVPCHFFLGFSGICILLCDHDDLQN
jgi:hypothetical protein